MNDEKWPIWKLSILMYPFAVGAVAVNLFMLTLMLQRFGITVISPEAAVVGGLFLGVPAGWAFAKWARHLMDQADT